MYLGDLELNLKDRMTGIDANLDDLQSGIEASLRTADALHSDASEVADALKQISNAPAIESLVRRASELQVSARDQRGVLQELRDAVDQLQDELKISKGTLKPETLSSAADRSRR